MGTNETFAPYMYLLYRGRQRTRWYAYDLQPL